MIPVSEVSGLSFFLLQVGTVVVFVVVGGGGVLVVGVVGVVVGGGTVVVVVVVLFFCWCCADAVYTCLQICLQTQRKHNSGPQWSSDPITRYTKKV